MIGNTCRNKVDATLRSSHNYTILEGNQGQLMFSALFLFDRYQLSNKINVDSLFFFLTYLLQNIFHKPVFINIYNQVIISISTVSILFL